MRKSKENFALLIICIGILFLIFSFIRGLPAAFMVGAGAAIIAYGLVSYLFEHFIHKIWRAKIMDEDERNIVINGKAYTLVSEFSNVGLIILALYSYICRHDLIGCIISVTIFVAGHIVYAVSFKYFDQN